ncbi:MAG: DNA-protecting protein DprA [Phycisphaerales bacterium]|nr:DNA-protecting protein DprA [Phycisphaerales bacterium]
MSNDPCVLPLLRLSLTPGLGSVLIARAIHTLGSVTAVLEASEGELRRIKGIGEEKARLIAAGLTASLARAEQEFASADALGVALIGIDEAAYPPLLKQTPDPPPVLYVLGSIFPESDDRYPIAIVGSRECTPYGREQAARFAGHLAQHGLTIVSGGARGIDSSAHQAALHAGGRTIAVLGCGLANRYPPDNGKLFDAIVAGSGALVSELPLATPPTADNFPARNRLISGLSLGVLVVEAAKRSGSLITARLAAEDHGREVFAVPGRVDSPASEGSLHLVKQGGALMVTHPADILEALESPARHLHGGSHEARYTMRRESGSAATDELFPTSGATEGPSNGAATGAKSERVTRRRDAGLQDDQQRVLAALTEPMSMDELARATGYDPASLRAHITMLEMSRLVARRGSRLARV